MTSKKQTQITMSIDILFQYQTTKAPKQKNTANNPVNLQGSNIIVNQEVVRYIYFLLSKYF